MEYDVQVFTMRPSAYSAGAGELAAWMNYKTGCGWTVSHVSHEVLADGTVVSVALAVRQQKKPPTAEEEMPPPAVETGAAATA